MININGIRKAKRNIRKNIRDLEDRSERELKRMTEEAESIAKERVPVDTGFLKDSITIDLNENSIVAGASYATFVEFGTVKQAPQPFLRPAAIQAFLNGVQRLKTGI